MPLSPPMAWLGMIVRSRALDFLRRRASERADTAVDSTTGLAETLAGDAADPMDTTQASEQAWACTSACASWRRGSARWSAWPTCAT
jgi:DNA-directed RNA polymerase specialized sigma24 family protein